MFLASLIRTEMNGQNQTAETQNYDLSNSLGIRTSVCFTDLQMVNISLRVLSRPDQVTLPEMYRQLGTDYDERVLPSICNEVCDTYMPDK